MIKEVIYGYDLQKMLASGLALLTQKHKEVDMLNVFPVPDGDTGTNMYLTLSAAVEESRKNNSKSVGDIAEAASRGALMGARGNSGVILSQLFRGFSLALKGKEFVTGKEFTRGLVEGVDLAVRAVMKPVEGTILTVARSASQSAVKASDRKMSIEHILEEACMAAENTLKNTPDMLPALKKAGVVDAGGMGWVIILRGFLSGLKGQENLDLALPQNDQLIVNPNDSSKDSNFRFPYCTEVLVRTDIPIEKLPVFETLGDSLLVAAQEGLVKIHIHTDHPGEIIETCLKLGPLVNVKINNMNEEAGEAAARKKYSKTSKSFGIISVASGEGITKIMESLGADEIIPGGQSMNPSIKELLQSVNEVDAETIIILPNNSNILLSANQVAGVTDKKVAIVPTRSIPEGLSALLAINPGMETDDAITSMSKAASDVKSGEVTYAVRDTVVNGIQINKGDIIGLFKDEIIPAGTIPEAVVNLLKTMISPDNEVCSIYYGKDIDVKDAENILSELQSVFPDVEFDIQYGGQPIYYYFISVE